MADHIISTSYIIFYPIKCSRNMAWFWFALLLPILAIILFKQRFSTKLTISLNSLPNDMLEEICALVGSSSISDIDNLHFVSKAFRNCCNKRWVVERVTLRDVPFLPWFPHNYETFSKFFDRCLRNGNPEALYRKGVYNYFDIGKNVLCLDDEEGDKGRACLAKASKKGNEKARYVYGMVCIAQGATKEEGLKVLSSLLKPMMSTTMEEMQQLRQNVRDEIEWGGRRRLRELKESYTYGGCNCNGGTKKFIKNNCAWNGYGINEDISTSSASFCEICFWDYEIGLFLENV